MRSIKPARLWGRLSILALGLCVLFQLSLSLVLNLVGQAQEAIPRNWVRLAPNRLALWGFSPDYLQDGLILVATGATERQSVRGIYRSSDRGKTWEVSSEGLIPKKRHYYTALAFSSGYDEDRTAWLFGHKTGLGRTEAFGGFWESTDAGKSWTEIQYEGFPYRKLTQRVSQDIVGLVVSSRVAEDGLMVAACGGEGVYISRDKGRNWELLSPVKDVLGIYAPPTFPDEPFLALSTSGSQVLISTDLGKTFVPSTEGLPADMRAVRGVAFSANFAQDRKMFCFGSSGVFASEDAGQSWKAIATPDESVTITAMATIGDFDEFGAIVYGTDGPAVYLSEDGGQTFRSVNAESLLSYRVDTVAFAPDYTTSKMLFASSQDGMFRYSPAKSAGAHSTAQAVAAGVGETRVARATTVAGLKFQAQKSDRVETGCIAYTFAPALPLVLLVGRRLRRRTWTG